MENFSNRLVLAMSKRNMKQSDLIKKTGINKGALSSYINGRYEPKQNNIFLLANALDVNEAWLMGYDVDMDRTSNNLILGSELKIIIEKISNDLNLPYNLVVDIFISLKNDTPLELNYDNIYLEIKKFLKNNFNKKWDSVSDSLNHHFLGFDYLLKSLGWDYEIIENKEDMNAYYLLKNNDLLVKLSNKDFNDFRENVISYMKNELQNIVIKSSNIFEA